MSGVAIAALVFGVLSFMLIIGLSLVIVIVLIPEINDQIDDDPTNHIANYSYADDKRILRNYDIFKNDDKLYQIKSKNNELYEEQLDMKAVYIIHFLDKSKTYIIDKNKKFILLI
jgi:hypothetical protein